MVLSVSCKGWSIPATPFPLIHELLTKKILTINLKLKFQTDTNKVAILEMDLKTSPTFVLELLENTKHSRGPQQLKMHTWI